VPPRSLKSICASVAFPAFILGHDPTADVSTLAHRDCCAAGFRPGQCRRWIILSILSRAAQRWHARSALETDTNRPQQRAQIPPENIALAEPLMTGAGKYSRGPVMLCITILQTIAFFEERNETWKRSLPIF
jgi:hypothetical protein